jgi:hypothetical protein
MQIWRPCWSRSGLHNPRGRDLVKDKGGRSTSTDLAAGPKCFRFGSDFGHLGRPQSSSVCTELIEIYYYRAPVGGYRRYRFGVRFSILLGDHVN